MIVKTMWEALVHVDEGDPVGIKDKDYAKGAHLFGQDVKLQPDDTYPSLAVWNGGDAIYIDLSNAQDCTLATDNNHRVYSLGCFYYRTVSGANFNPAIANPEILQSCVTQKCYMILVGVHIMTRETPNWIWMTYYWTSRTHDVPKNKWDLFVADATNNDVSYTANPYLEGPPNGMHSNCMECHRRALYSPTRGPSIGIPSGVPSQGSETCNRRLIVSKMPCRRIFCGRSQFTQTSK